MSNETSADSGNGERRRSRGGRNRNRNRSRRNGESRGEGENRSQGEGGGNRNRNRDRNRNRNRNREDEGNVSGSRNRRPAPKPVPLTWWQKLLKALGLYTPPKPKGRTRRSDKAAPKSNIRDARADSTGSREDERPPRKKRERKPREPREERQTPSTEDVDSKRLYLGNLSYEASETDLEELFRGVGSVRRVEIVYNRQTHRSKGYGFIEMLNVDEAKKAVEILHDQFFMGRKLVVSSAKSDGPAQKAEEPEEFRPRDVAPEPKPEVTPEAAHAAETSVADLPADTPEEAVTAEAAPEPEVETPAEPTPEGAVASTQADTEKKD